MNIILVNSKLFLRINHSVINSHSDPAKDKYSSFHHFSVPRPELRPPDTFYHTKSGIKLPNIHCSVNCHPTCDLQWYKIGSPAVLSFNETLSLGVLDRNSSGEYICMAINSETTEKSSISFYVLIQEDKGTCKICMFFFLYLVLFFCS